MTVCHTTLSVQFCAPRDGHEATRRAGFFLPRDAMLARYVLWARVCLLQLTRSFGDGWASCLILSDGADSNPTNIAPRLSVCSSCDLLRWSRLQRNASVWCLSVLQSLCLVFFHVTLMRYRSSWIRHIQSDSPDSSTQPASSCDLMYCSSDSSHLCCYSSYSRKNTVTCVRVLL